jgi:asparagine synthase (glutamine-hydrolysing)
LLDHLLLETVMGLPGHLKLDPKMPKPLLVRSLPEALPGGVINGPKKGFVLPYANWLHGELRAEVEEAFGHPPAALEGIVNEDGARAVWRSFQNGKCSWTRPWSIFVLYQVVERLLTSPGAGLESQTELSFADVSPELTSSGGVA